MSVRTPLAAHAQACEFFGACVPLGAPRIADRQGNTGRASDLKTENRYIVTILGWAADRYIVTVLLHAHASYICFFLSHKTGQTLRDLVGLSGRQFRLQIVTTK